MILRFWRWLFGGCEHHWEELEAANILAITKGYNYEKNPKRIVGRVYYLGCTKCGDRTSRELTIDD